MTADTKAPQAIKLTPYTASPRRYRGDGNNIEWYWTVRCRRQGSEGEWTLGWFTSRRVAERSLTEWVAAQTGKRSRSGAATMIEMLDQYGAAVAKMTDKRPNTIASRRYTASQLRAFIIEHCPNLLAERFDDTTFAEYRVWLDRKYSHQTVQTALIGARTTLKWASAAKFIGEPPKCPKYLVPQCVRALLEPSQIAAIVDAATEDPDECERLPLLLRLLAETGMRPSEAFAFQRCDISTKTMMITVKRHIEAGYSPKTRRSHREIPISRELVGDLLALAAGDEPLFAATGVDRVYHYWRHRFQRACRVAGVPEATLGSFRRTRSTRLLDVGTPLHVYQRMMGHSIATALEHYATVRPAGLRDAFDKAGRDDLGDRSDD